MKRFDKNYVYSSLLSDFFLSLVILFSIFGDFFIEEDIDTEALSFSVPIAIALFILIYVCFTVYRILYYKSSGYELTKTEIKCHRGVFFKKHSVLDYKKIHAINKRQSIIHKIFGIAVLTVDSGSANTSHQAEITIIEKSAITDALLSELNLLKENGIRGDVNEQKAEEVLLSDKDSLYRFTSAKKMLYTLINIASTAFFTAVFALLAIIVIGVCKGALQLDALGTWGQYFLYAVLITIGGVLLFSIFSFIGSIIYSFVGYYHFTITKQNNNIQISYGLLEKHTNTFSYDRIKAVKITQGLVQRMLGFASIRLEVIGYTVNSGDDDKNAALGVLVPFCKYGEIGEILDRILPDYVPDEKQSDAVSYFPFVSWFFLIFGGIAGIALLQTAAVLALLKLSSGVISIVALSIFGAAVTVLAIKAVSALLAYKTSGVTIRCGKITAYYGGFTKNVTVFMHKNLVAAESVTTPLREKCGIATLVMHLKTNADSNEVKVHIQRNELAGELEKLLIV